MPIRNLWHAHNIQLEMSEIFSLERDARFICSMCNAFRLDFMCAVSMHCVEQQEHRTSSTNNTFLATSSLSPSHICSELFNRSALTSWGMLEMQLESIENNIIIIGWWMWTSVDNYVSLLLCFSMRMRFPVAFGNWRQHFHNPMPIYDA